MSLTFEISDMPAVRLLSVKTVTDQEHFGADIEHLISSIYKLVNGWASGPPVCMYPDGYDPAQVIAVAGIPYRGDPCYGYETTELPACRAVVGHYTGAYAELGDAWRDTMAYVAENGLSMSGAPYERYLAPTSTEIVVPVD